MELREREFEKKEVRLGETRNSKPVHGKVVSRVVSKIERSV